MGADDLDAQADGLVPGLKSSSGWPFQDQHSSRVPSTISWAVGSSVPHDWHLVVENVGDQGCEAMAWEMP